jgi:DNA primase
MKLTGLNNPSTCQVSFIRQVSIKELMVMDLELIKSQLDVRTIAEQLLGKPAMKSQKYLAFKCPFHGEHKGSSLVVYFDGWKCFGSCAASGDVFSFVAKVRGLDPKNDFAEILRYLGYSEHGIQRKKPIHRVVTPRPETLEAAAAPSQEWQFYGELLVKAAQDMLWSEQGERALAYLYGRGLRPAAIKTARLGYISAESPQDYEYGTIFDAEWQHDGKTVRAHCGIYIPHFADGQLWAIRVRRPPGIGGPKYVGIRGGTKALYLIDEVEPRLPVLLVEGEFDALITLQEAGPGASVEVCPLALASASNKRIAPNWLDRLVSAPVIFSRMDGDGAGGAANEVLQGLSHRVKPVQVPAPHKDINELYLSDGGEAVRSWLQEVLNG